MNGKLFISMWVKFVKIFEGLCCLFDIDGSTRGFACVLFIYVGGFNENFEKMDRLLEILENNQKELNELVKINGSLRSHTSIDQNDSQRRLFSKRVHVVL